MSTRKSSPASDHPRNQVDPLAYPPTSEESHIDAHTAFLKADLGSHVGPPVRKTDRCGHKVKTMFMGLMFTCTEMEDHRGSHYGVAEDGDYDLAWNGPDELKKGDYHG